MIAADYLLMLIMLIWLFFMHRQVNRLTDRYAKLKERIIDLEKDAHPVYFTVEKLGFVPPDEDAEERDVETDD